MSARLAHGCRTRRCSMRSRFARALDAVPAIYLITLGAFSTQDAVYSYPRELLPRITSRPTRSASSSTPPGSCRRSNAAS